ncbi:alpha-galactosidase [Paenibacillus xanthanilyticus]|uniref:Alpha-galactosidase n=1 Tax=Paenibacillus xanthanilyticus TaxID=1783531 RepID=A0ABV8K673_9BACL
MSKNGQNAGVGTVTDENSVTVNNGIVSVTVRLTEGTYEISWRNGDRIKGAEGKVKLKEALRGTTDYVRHEARISESEDALGRGITVTVLHEETGFPSLEQQFTVYEGEPYVSVRIAAIGSGAEARTNYMAPLAVQGSNGAEVRAAGGVEELRALRVPFDNDKWVRYESTPLLSGVAIESYEATAIYAPASRKGLVVGSLTHDTWKTGIRIAAEEGASSGAIALEAFGGASGELTRDSIPHGEVAGDRVNSPLLFIGSYADYRDGLEAFAQANAKLEPALDWAGGVPFGWNSWSAAADKLDYDLYVSTSDFLRTLHATGFHNDGVVYVNFDSFWTSLSEDQLQDAVAHVQANGQKAGIYWTPFTFWGHDASQAVEGTNGAYSYDDLLLRDREGSVLPSLDGGLSIDPTHPGNLLRTEYHLARFVDWGFEYVKLDFLGHGAVEGNHYDPAIRTGIQAYHFGMAAIRDRLAPERIGRPFHINLSIAPLFPYQYGHSRRISCDAFGLIGDTEYMLNALTYGWWMNDALYRYNDPDHTVLYKSFNQEATAHHEGRSRLTASVIAGTVMLLGDDYRNEEARKRAEAWLANEDVLRLARLGRTFAPVEGCANAGAADAFTLRTAEGDSSVLYVAVFNYDQDAMAESTVSFERLGLTDKTGNYRVRELWSGEEWIAADELRLSLEAMEAKLVRIEFDK